LNFESEPKIDYTYLSKLALADLISFTKDYIASSASYGVPRSDQKLYGTMAFDKAIKAGPVLIASGDLDRIFIGTLKGEPAKAQS
jgi:hypothetical protein